MRSARLVNEDTAAGWIFPRQISVWLISLVLHLAALLLAALLTRGTDLPPAADEPQRWTSLAPSSVDLSVNLSPSYFSEDETGPGSALTDAASGAAGPSARGGAESPLHSDLPPPAAGIELPGGVGPDVDAGLFVGTSSSGTGRGKNRMSGLTAADVAAILAEDAARPRQSGPTGPTTKLSLFGSAEAEGRSFVFLIDRSQSMGHGGLGAIAAAAKELSSSIDRLGPEHKFQVIAYNEKPRSLGGSELIQATQENKERLIQFVATTVAFGGTEHELGLFAALRLKPEVIFLFTDGGDPKLNASQLRSIREAAAQRTAIHCLHFGSGPLADEKNFLVRLAEQNRGSYVYIDMRKRE